MLMNMRIYMITFHEVICVVVMRAGKLSHLVDARATHYIVLFHRLFNEITAVTTAIMKVVETDVNICVFHQLIWLWCLHD